MAEEKKDTKKVQLVEMTVEDAAREALENTIKSIHKATTERDLDEDEIKSLSQMVDALLKIRKEDREIAEKYTNMSDADLIKAAKRATKVLKKKKM